MFDIAPSELLLVAVVALVVIGPKDLPRVMRVVGQWVARARGMARHFREGVDEMIRQSELQEMEQKWRAENERIMREHPPIDHAMTTLPPSIDYSPPPEAAPSSHDAADPVASPDAADPVPVVTPHPMTPLEQPHPIETAPGVKGA